MARLGVHDLLGWKVMENVTEVETDEWGLPQYVAERGR